MGKQERITLKDIAKACGYTINTVSRALRNDEKLPISTRKAIQDIADDMGYIRNSLASTLRSGTSHTVAVIVNDIQNQHFATMLGEIDANLRAAGYNMMILCTQLDEKLGEQMILTAISQSVDGILYFPYHSNQEHIDYMIKNNMPFVLMDRWIQGVSADTSRCDDEQGGYIAGKHLAGQGHKKYLYLAGSHSISSQIDRESGFLRALAEANIRPEDIRIASWEEVDAALKADNWDPLLFPLDYTAILSFNDEMAYNVLNTFNKRGVRVPEDVSLISFDHIRACIHYLPPLTSIAEADTLVSEMAVRTLLTRIREPNLPTQIHVLPVKIFDEGTTATPNIGKPDVS